MIKKYACISLFPDNELLPLKALQQEIFELTWSELYRLLRDMHTTVWVWNDLEDDEVREIWVKLQEVAHNHRSFEVKLSELKFRTNLQVVNLGEKI